MNSVKKGKMAEEIAINFLKENGFEIIDKNFYCKGGEIDIIAIKNRVYHFIEVKSGSKFEPIYNITYKKLNKIIKCVTLFLQKKKIDLPFCIDAIIIKNSEIDFIENLTL
ncbi:MAG: YraN family protein [Nautiliaceae bacterium]